MLKKSFIFLFIAITLPLFLIIKHPVSAQEKLNQLDLTVNPTVIEITNNPQSNIQGKFRIRNNTDTPITLQISLNKLLPNGTYDSVNPVAISSHDEFIKWITFSQATVSALPKEW